MFDRAANLAGTQIINYAVSPDGQWLMTVGIKPGAAGGGVEGAMQLFSVEKKVSQPLTSHAGCFHACKLPGRSDTAILFAFVDQKPGVGPKLMIIEVGKDRNAPGGVFRLAPQDLPVPPEATAAGDFPVSMQASKKHDVLYILTKAGFAYVYDVPTGAVIFRHKIADTPVFTAAVHEASGGVLAITARTGQVLLLTLNEGALVPYVSNQLKNTGLAMALASRLGLGGADELYVAHAAFADALDGADELHEASVPIVHFIRNMCAGGAGTGAVYVCVHARTRAYHAPPPRPQEQGARGRAV
jgi:clathrin heavy chain